MIEIKEVSKAFGDNVVLDMGLATAYATKAFTGRFYIELSIDEKSDPGKESIKLFTLQILDRGRISIAAMALGLGYGALEMATAYAKDRRQFGRPIADFQAILGSLDYILPDTDR